MNKETTEKRLKNVKKAVVSPLAAPIKKVLPPEALRALAEAEERRENYRQMQQNKPKEIGGRGGHDPARYGDWEIKGKAIDF